jgi:hypothetical protein
MKTNNPLTAPLRYGGRNANIDSLVVAKVFCSASTFVVKIPAFAKPEIFIKNE